MGKDESELKNSVSFAGDRLVIAGYIVGEKESRALMCCGNCRHYEPCTYDGDQCDVIGGYTQGYNFCEKWEIAE